MLKCKIKTLCSVFALSVGFSTSAMLLAKYTQASAYPQVIAQLKIIPTVEGMNEKGILIYSSGKVTQYRFTSSHTSRSNILETQILNVSKNLIPRLKKLINKASPDSLKELNIQSPSCEKNPGLIYEIRNPKGEEMIVGVQKQCLSYIPANHDHSSLEIRSLLDALNSLNP